MKPVGYPYRPENHMNSSCGTTVLAAILGISTKEAEKLIAKDRPKGYRGFTNVGDIRGVLENKGILFKHVKEWKGIKILPTLEEGQMAAVFIQIEGPWVERGWRSAYNHTHWALLHGLRVMDVNNIHYTATDEIPWILRSNWLNDIMPLLIDCEEDATGWYIKGGYKIYEPKFL